MNVSTFFEAVSNVEFAAPGRIVLGLPIALVLVAAPWMRRETRRGSTPALLLRAGGVAMLLALLLEPFQVRTEHVKGSVTLVADVSPSVAEQGLHTARRFAGTAEASFDLVLAGAEPTVWREVAPQDAVSRLRPDPRPGTDLAAALVRATVLRRAGLPHRVVLLTDGRATVPGAAEAARRLRAAGAQLVVRGIGPPPAQQRPEWRVDGVESPPLETRPAPLEVRARIRKLRDTGRAAAVVAVLYVDGKPVRSQEVDPKAGEDQIVRFAGLELEPGRYLAQVRLQVEGGDAAPLDDVGGAVVHVPERPRVLLLAAQPRPSLWKNALETQGLRTEIRGAAENWETTPFDAIVILPDAPAEALEKRTADLNRWLGVRGGGLVAVGGAGGEGLARFHETAFGFLLPLDVQPRPPEPEPEPPVQEPKKGPDPKIEIVEKEEEAFPVSLLLLVDHSFSMAEDFKLQRAVQSALATAQLMGKQDRIAVIGFADEARVLVPFTAGGNVRLLERALRKLRPQGYTAMFRAIQLGAALIVREKSAIRHVVLISDGVATDNGPWKKLITSMAQRKITLSTVGIGFDVDPRLPRLATWGGGKWWTANNPRQIPQVVTQDTKRILKIRDKRGLDAKRAAEKKRKAEEKKREEEADRRKAEEEDKEPESPKREPPAIELVPLLAEAGAPRDALKGVPDDTLPKVGRVEKGKPRFAAWVSARAGRNGPPALAYGRVGLGTTAALALDPADPANAPLREHPEFGRILAQLVRSVLPDVSRPPWVLEHAVRAGPDGGRLALEVRGEDGQRRTDLRITASLVRGDEPVPLPVRRRGGVYEAELPAGEGPLHLRVEAASGEERTRSDRIVPRRRAAEEAQGVDPRALRALRGGVDALPLAEARWWEPPTLARQHREPWRLPFLVLAAILLPLDAWVRRRAARSASR